MKVHALCGAVFAVCIGLFTGGEIGGQERRDRRDRWRGANPPRNGDRDGGEERVFFERRTDDGFVFIDGKYVPPPYTLQQTSRGVVVNGAMVRPNPDWNRGPGRWGRRGWGARGSHLSLRDVAEQLSAGGILVSFPDRPLVMVRGSVHSVAFLKAAADPSSRDGELAEVLNGNVPVDERSWWKEWLSSFEPPAELVARANPVIEEFEARSRSEHKVFAARKRLDALSGPLSVAGMVLGVLALGHLLMSRPGVDPSNDETLRRQVIRATLISVALIAVMSGFDLTWTLLAYQTGDMQELNPLGNRLIDNPAMLIAFKTAATLLGCCILIGLRRHKSARLASWWMCLVLTVLTFRWIVLNPFFMAT